MRAHTLASSFLMVFLGVNPADSCEIAWVRTGLPSIDAARATGTVTGYGEVVRPVPGVEQAVGLKMRIDTVVSGPVSPGDVVVVPLFYTPDCRSASMRYEDVVQRFPVGMRVGVSAKRGGVPLVVEANQNDFVVEIPDGIARTIDGDVDFEWLDPSRHGRFGEFEIDRTVLSLSAASNEQRFRRMMNLARYHGLHEWRGGSKWFAALLAEARLTPAQRAEVIAVFPGFSQAVP